MDYALVYITAANREEALSISRALLAEKLIACANVYDNVTSLYWWQGEIEHNPEAVIIAKTRVLLTAQLTERVKALHSYDTPCIVTVPISGGNPDFLRWIGHQTEPRQG